MAWSGAFPIMFGLAAVAYASHAMCGNADKRTSKYQFNVALIFSGVLAAFCGVVMMATGLGIHLFSGRSPGVGMSGMGMGGGGYGGGYGMF